MMRLVRLVGPAILSGMVCACGDVEVNPGGDAQCELEVTQVNGESAGSRERVESFDGLTLVVEGDNGFSGDVALFVECFVNEDDEFAAYEGEILGFDFEASTGQDPTLYRVTFTLGARFSACDVEVGDAESMQDVSEERCTPARIRLLQGE